MPAKLTLRLDDALIARAKQYAAGQDRSLSQLVADYFTHLAVKPASADKSRLRSPGTGPALGPVTTALHGALGASSAKRSAKPGTKISVDRSGYRAYLEEKHR